MASKCFLKQSLIPKYGVINLSRVINLSKLLMKPQCPGTCSSWKGCCILVTSWHLGLLFPMSAANMSTTEPLPIHYSDWIRGKTVPGPIIDLICSAVLKVLPSASGFLLQTWQRIRIVPMHWVQILQGITSPAAWIKNIKATALFHKQGIMMTFFLLDVISQLLRL